MIGNTSIWTALADSKRRQIIRLLAEKPRTTNNLTEFFDVSRFAIMKHLKVLENANLIKVKREGRQRWNILNDDLEDYVRSKLSEEDGPAHLIDVLDLFPAEKQTNSSESDTVEPFHIKQSVLLQASPDQVYRCLTDFIDSWWKPRNSANSKIVLEACVNGRLYEAFNTKDGLLYAIVTGIKQNEEIRLSGTIELTEYMSKALLPNNFIRINLHPQNESTQLVLRHYFVGFVDEATSDVCKFHWQTLLNQHLKPFIERGLPYQHNP